MEFVHTQWLKQPSNLVLIGPAGVGKTHLATALCYEAILQGHQTVLLSLFDLTAKLTKARNLYSLIDYYAKIPISASMSWAMWSLPKNRPIGSSRSSPNEQRSPPLWLLPILSLPTGERSLIRSPPRPFGPLSMNGKFITFEGRSYRSKK